MPNGPRPITFSKLWSLQLLNHRKAVIELHIGLSSTNKQARDTLVTTVFYHFFAPEGGHPALEEHHNEKKMLGPFF